MAHEIAVKGTKNNGHDFFYGIFMPLSSTSHTCTCMYHENAMNIISTAFSWCLKHYQVQTLHVAGLIIHIGSVIENNPYGNSAYFRFDMYFLSYFFLSFLYFFSIFLDHFKVIFYLF